MRALPKIAPLQPSRVTVSEDFGAPARCSSAALGRRTARVSTLEYPGPRRRHEIPAGGSGRKEPVISVTSKSRYAVVALAELTRTGAKPVPIATVAERRGMPVQFLEQLFSTLRRAGLVDSRRGAKGGYTLARSPDQITVLEVVQALEGRIGTEAEEAGGIWADGVEVLRVVFSSTTIADIASREAADSGAGAYQI